ncbi:MAG: TlpA family protein disulfide reductase [Rhodoglobus sp.]|nr:TlpA family protein disulfide reductase [Rhodoglobus sp.]
MKKLVLAVGIVLLLALAGCTPDKLANQYASGSGQGYVSGDGANTEIPPASRDAAVEFSGTDESGGAVSSQDYAGKVYVVNFWYAACPPCRSEASDLKTLSDKYADVQFLGVNISDSADVAKIFETKYGLQYPSILDGQTASVQLAFSGAVAPNAVPTTLVMDREGRVAARISGLIRDPIILSGMIDRVVAEAGK